MGAAPRRPAFVFPWGVYAIRATKIHVIFTRSSNERKRGASPFHDICAHQTSVGPSWLA